MGLQEFSRDVIPVFQFVISTIGVVSVILAWYQLKISNAWNRLNSQHQMLGNLPSVELEISVWEIYRAHKSASADVLDETAPEAIFLDVTKWVQVKTFINKYEQMCAAINAKSFDDHYAYSVHCNRIINTYEKFLPFIRWARNYNNDDQVYIELEKVAYRWKHMQQNQKEKLISSGGTPPKLPPR